MDAQQVLTSAQDAMSVRRVFGDPIQVDGTTIIPVAVVGGGGGGGARAQEGGVGFGLRARPAGVFAVRDGSVSWRPALNLNLVILGGQIVALTAVVAARQVLLAWLRGRA